MAGRGQTGSLFPRRPLADAADAPAKAVRDNVSANFIENKQAALRAGLTTPRVLPSDSKPSDSKVAGLRVVPEETVRYAVITTARDRYTYIAPGERILEPLLLTGHFQKQYGTGVYSLITSFG